MKKILSVYTCVLVCAYTTYAQGMRTSEFVWDSLTHSLSIYDKNSTPLVKIDFPPGSNWNPADTSMSFNPTQQTCSRIFTINAYADSEVHFSWLPCISKAKAVWDKKTPIRKYRDWHYFDINLIEPEGSFPVYIHDPEWLMVPLKKNSVYKLIATWKNGYEICGEVKIKISLPP